MDIATTRKNRPRGRFFEKTHMGPKPTKRSRIENFGGMFFSFVLFGQYFVRNSGFEIFMITMGLTVILKISNPECLPKIWPNQKK